jgi:hypothetical protein
MKKLFYIILLVAFSGVSDCLQAQLSEREDNPSVLKVGTRPVKGDFGLLFGPSFVELEDFADKDIDIRGLPLLKFKYYLSDNFELRLGIQNYKRGKSFDGALAPDNGGYTIDNELKSFFRLTPGVAYHFSHKNILNIYVGGEIPFGSDKYRVDRRYEMASALANRDYMETNITKTTSVYGYSFFIGMQAFIADLPMAIGVEYGMARLVNSNLQYEVDYSERIDGSSESFNYFTANNPLDYYDLVEYSDLKYSKFESGANLRLTFSYYFMK